MQYLVGFCIFLICAVAVFNYEAMKWYGRFQEYLIACAVLTGINESLKKEIISLKKTIETEMSFPNVQVQKLPLDEYIQPFQRYDWFNAENQKDCKDETKIEISDFVDKYGSIE